jgi:hypothetical protein
MISHCRPIRTIDTAVTIPAQTQAVAKGWWQGLNRGWENTLYKQRPSCLVDESILRLAARGPL